jgi:hypothetical protein
MDRRNLVFFVEIYTYDLKKRKKAEPIMWSALFFKTPPGAVIFPSADHFMRSNRPAEKMHAHPRSLFHATSKLLF